MFLMGLLLLLTVSSNVGVTCNDHQDSASQSTQQIDLSNCTTITPISLLVQSLVKQLCFLLEKDKDKENQLYNTICEKLHGMNLIDDSYTMGEFEAMRSHYQRALYQLVTAVNGSEIPKSLPVTWPIVEASGLEWSRYHRDFEELCLIASGGFGTVFKARNRFDGVEYAVKKVFIKSSDVNSVKLDLLEAKTIASLNHPNIVNYKAAWLEPIISSVHPNNTGSCRIYSSSEITKANRSSEPIIIFKKPESFEQDKSSYLIEELEDFDFEDSTEESLEEENAVAVSNLNLMKEYQNSSRASLEWATLYIQMTLCEQTLRQWLDNRNNHMTISRKGSEDFTLHYNESSESVCLNSLDLTYPIDWTHIDVLIDMFTQLVKGLHYVHSRGVIHHDVKPSNIFVAKNEGGCTVQLGDFGLACPLQQSHGGLALGTPLYAAPEQLEGQCNPKSDMYSIGIILLEMVEPFSTEMERMKIITDLREGQLPAHLTVNYPKIAHIIAKLVAHQPSKRPDTAQLLEELNYLVENKNETIKLLQEKLAAKDEEIVKLKTMLTKFNNQ